MICALLAIALIPALAPAQIAKFRVRETAGLRRFSFPVRASFAEAAGPLQLIENGKTVPAQFTALDGRTEVDFNVSLGPGETREYRVEKGESAAAGAGCRHHAGGRRLHGAPRARVRRAR
jgi:hypothetical protein